MSDNCVWCKTNPKKDGYQLCERCFNLNEGDSEYNKASFICPVCRRKLDGRIICPECGVVRTALMSLPAHCYVCHCQFWYEDTNSVKRCWCCNAEIEKQPSGIDEYIMYALAHFDDFKKWSDERKGIPETVCPKCGYPHYYVFRDEGKITSWRECQKCGEHYEVKPIAKSA